MSRVSDASHPTNPNVAKAAEVMVGVSGDTCRAGVAWAYDVSKRLDSAGVILTPHHERAILACEALSLHLPHSGRACWPPDFMDAMLVGRESLASKKPKDSWTMRLLSGDLVPARWGVYSANSDSAYAMFSGSEPQARAVAEALNALEAK